MKTGIYKAKVIDYGIYEGKDETKTHFKVIFEVLDPSEVLPKPERFDWNGYMTGGAAKITKETLIGTFGLDMKNFKNFNRGIGSKAINEDVEYELDLQEETYEGKTRLKIKYVNLPGAARRSAKMSDDAASIFLAGLNMEAEIVSKSPPKINNAEAVPF